MVDMKSALASTGTNAPTKALVSTGVITTAASVLTVVIITLSATSALARKVTTLLAVPPGQLATKQILQALTDVVAAIPCYGRTPRQQDRKVSTCVGLHLKLEGPCCARSACVAYKHLVMCRIQQVLRTC